MTNEPDFASSEYLSQVANEIGYRCVSQSSQPTDHRFFKHGVEICEVGKLLLPDDNVATIYSFDAEALTTDFSSQIKRELCNTEQSFAVDWPVKGRDGKLTYLTFYFSELPGKKEIITARTIRQVEFGIIDGLVDQHFLCEECSQKHHWTKLADGSPDTFNLQVMMLKHQSCYQERMDENPQAWRDLIATETSTSFNPGLFLDLTEFIEGSRVEVDSEEQSQMQMDQAI